MAARAEGQQSRSRCQLPISSIGGVGRRGFERRRQPPRPRPSQLCCSTTVTAVMLSQPMPRVSFGSFARHLSSSSDVASIGFKPCPSRSAMKSTAWEDSQARGTLKHPGRQIPPLASCLAPAAVLLNRPLGLQKRGSNKLGGRTESYRQGAAEHHAEGEGWLCVCLGGGGGLRVHARASAVDDATMALQGHTGALLRPFPHSLLTSVFGHFPDNGRCRETDRRRHKMPLHSSNRCTFPSPSHLLIRDHIPDSITGQQEEAVVRLQPHVLQTGRQTARAP
jgi:hypothetical protein